MQELDIQPYFDIARSDRWERSVKTAVAEVLLNSNSLSAHALVIVLGAKGVLRSEIEPKLAQRFITVAINESSRMTEEGLSHIVDTPTTFETEKRQTEIALAMASGDPFKLSLKFAAEELKELGYKNEEILILLKCGTDQLHKIRNNP